jgi:hypothetical protein
MKYFQLRCAGIYCILVPRLAKIRLELPPKSALRYKLKLGCIFQTANYTESKKFSTNY